MQTRRERFTPPPQCLRRGAPVANQVETLTVPVAQRRDSKLTVTRGGELYGCELNVYVKATVGGNVIHILDPQGQSLKEFVQSKDVRTVPMSVLQGAEHVAIDVFVTVKQPSALTGTIKVDAVLDMPGQKPSPVGDTLQLKPGEVAGVLNVGWGIDA